MLIKIVVEVQVNERCDDLTFKTRPLKLSKKLI